MLKFWCICNDTRQSILYALYFVQVILRNAIVEWITIIKFAGDEWIGKRYGCRTRKEMTNTTDVSYMKMTRLRQWVNPYLPEVGYDIPQACLLAKLAQLPKFKKNLIFHRINWQPFMFTSPLKPSKNIWCPRGSRWNPGPGYYIPHLR